MISRYFGPEPTAFTTRFRLYAPDAGSVAVEIEGRAPRVMERGADGVFTVETDRLRPGTRYRFDADGRAVPDPASRRQADDADGWSVLVAPMERPTSRWSRPWHEAVIVEVHVGTATAEGTFRGLIDRLDHWRDAGFTMIELMPVADFPGRRNWGYDGVLIYAPDSAYGTPEDLRALVDAAHQRGLGMMLDVVYNHFGPSGNHLPHYAKSFFREDLSTPWGPAIDLENEIVRAFFTENAAYWLSDFGFDGLRFDAVHALAGPATKTFLTELAGACRAVRPDAALVLENHDNVAGWLARDPPLFTAQWNDDWHHAFHVLATGETTGYYRPYAADAPAAAGRALAEGFVFQGEPYPDAEGKPRGTPSADLPPDAFVAFAQNHDHIGNRPLGDRLTANLAADRLAFLRFVLMLSPEIPLLFQGEEALLATPFPFFCDFSGDLARAVREGRRAEFPEFFASHEAADFPDPLDEATFRSAVLSRDVYATDAARRALDGFRALAAARRRIVWPLAATAFEGAEFVRHGDALAVDWRFAAGRLVMALNPSAEPASLAVPSGGEGRAPAAEVGAVETDDHRLRLGPFAAAVWSFADR